MSPILERIWKQCHHRRTQGLEPSALYISHDMMHELLNSPEDKAYLGEYTRRNTIFGLKVFTVDRTNDHVYVAGELK